MSPAWAQLHSHLGQATYTCVPLSPSSIIWYWLRAVIPVAEKVTAGLVESNGCLYRCVYYNSVTYDTDCQETGSTPSTTLDLEYGSTFMSSSSSSPSPSPSSVNLADLQTNQIFSHTCGQLTWLLLSMPDTEYVYIMYFPPLADDGEHSLVSGSCSLPQL